MQKLIGVKSHYACVLYVDVLLENIAIAHLQDAFQSKTSELTNEKGKHTLFSLTA